MTLLLRMYLVGAVILGGAVLICTVRPARETRLRSATLLGLITLMAAVLSTGTPGVLLLVGVLAVLSLRDLRALHPMGGAFWVVVPALMLVLVVGPVLLPVARAWPAILVGWLVCMLGALRALTADKPSVRPPGSRLPLTTTVLVSGAVALAYSALAVLGVHRLNHVLAAIMLAQANDSFAYLGGRRWGRTRLAPVISPGKTREGVLAGALGTAVFAALLATPVLPALNAHTAAQVALIALTVSGLGTAGDLFLSLAKRRAGLKDFPAALPGHGGILDRFDSMVGLLPVLLAIAAFTLGDGP